MHRRQRIKTILGNQLKFLGRLNKFVGLLDLLSFSRESTIKFRNFFIASTKIRKFSIIWHANKRERTVTYGHILVGNRLCSSMRHIGYTQQKLWRGCSSRNQSCNGTSRHLWTICYQLAHIRVDERNR